MVLLGSGGICPQRRPKSKWVWSENNTILNYNPWHREEELQDIYSNKTPKMQ